MHSQASLQHSVSLRNFNTFGIEARAQHYVRVTSTEQLLAVFADPALAALPRLVLGGGSNLLLTQDVAGLVLHMAMQGRTLVGQDE